MQTKARITVTVDPQILERVKASFPYVPLSRLVEISLKKAAEAGRSWLL